MGSRSIRRRLTALRRNIPPSKLSISLAEQRRRRFAKVLAHGHQEAGAIPVRDFLCAGTYPTWQEVRDFRRHNRDLIKQTLIQASELAYESGLRRALAQAGNCERHELEDNQTQSGLERCSSPKHGPTSSSDFSPRAAVANSLSLERVWPSAPSVLLVAAR